MEKKVLDGFKKRIMEVNSIIKGLDPAIKLPAFEMLKPYIAGALEGTEAFEGNGGKNNHGQLIFNDNVRDFYSKYQPDTPAEGAKVLAAWIYRQQKTQPFTLKQIGELFDEIGEGQPSRLDMTLKQAQRDGRKLFQSLGGGKFRPNVHGENYFKEMFKGTLAKEK